MRTLEELVARAIDHVCAMTGDLKSYSDFLTYLVDTVLPPLHAVIAAGHAATFALPHACARPGSFKQLVLIAPTWRGPLPTMMNGRRPLFDDLCRLVDLPVIGPLLYGLNVNRFVIRYMAAGVCPQHPRRDVAGW